MKQWLAIIGFLLIMLGIISNAIQETKFGLLIKANVIAGKDTIIVAIGSILLLIGIFGFNWLYILFGTILIVGGLKLVGMI